MVEWGYCRRAADAGAGLDELARAAAGELDSPLRTIYDAADRLHLGTLDGVNYFGEMAILDNDTRAVIEDTADLIRERARRLGIEQMLKRLGRFDRAWGPERPIFGKIRYMSSENTARKVAVKKYLRRYAAESQQNSLA